MSERLNQKQNADRDTGGAASGGFTAEELGRESAYEGATTFAKRMRRGNRLKADRKERGGAETKMKNRTILSLAILGLVSAGCGVAWRLGAAGWQRETDALVDNLEQAAAANGDTVSFRDFDDLPAPAARYLRYALKAGQPFVRTARIRHDGEFKLNDKWIPFVSTQNFAAHPPAFVWDAEMKMNWLMNVSVRDAYVAGRGSTTAKISSLFPVVGERDDPKLDAGALQRRLAEAVWLPTALLPSENLKWTAIDNRKALATLTDSGTIASLEFEFNETGEIIGVFAPERFRQIKGKYESFPWKGRFRTYREQSGMMIPLEGEAEWQMPEEIASYWKGKIVEARYEFVPPTAP